MTTNREMTDKAECLHCGSKIERGPGGLWYSDATASTCYENRGGGGHNPVPGPGSPIAEPAKAVTCHAPDDKAEDANHEDNEAMRSGTTEAASSIEEGDSSDEANNLPKLPYKGCGEESGTVRASDDSGMSKMQVGEGCRFATPQPVIDDAPVVNKTYIRGAERLADEVDKLIQRKVIGSRSPAADALLDFRDGDVGRPTPTVVPDAKDERCPKCNHFWHMHDQAEMIVTGCAESEGYHECGCRELSPLYPLESKPLPSEPQAIEFARLDWDDDAAVVRASNSHVGCATYKTTRGIEAVYLGHSLGLGKDWHEARTTTEKIQEFERKFRPSQLAAKPSEPAEGERQTRVPKSPSNDKVKAMAVCDTSAALSGNAPEITMSDVGTLARHYLYLKSAAKAEKVDESSDLVEALTIIARWDEADFPVSGHFWDTEKTRPMRYGAAFGSNGERDYMRNIAAKALEAYRELKKRSVGGVK